LHYGELTVAEIKDYLHRKDVPIRIWYLPNSNPRSIPNFLYIL
jgi:hypothetical protein